MKKDEIEFEKKCKCGTDVPRDKVDGTGEYVLLNIEGYKPFPETSFFVVCDKCENQIFMHKGWTEYPEGKFTFNVECNCGFKFQHVFVTAQFRKDEQARIMTQSLNPKAIGNILKAVKDKIEGKDY